MTKQVELSYHQESWLRHITEDISGYNIPGVALVSGTLNKKKLQSSVNKVISNTDITRSYFVKNNQQFECHIKDKIDYCIEHIDASTLSEKKINEKILSLQKHQFNIQKPPLFQIKILTINETKHLFCLCFHHLINDAIGASIFTKKLVSEYYNRTEGNIGEISYQFSDFLEEQQLKIDRQLQRKKNFWRKIHDFEPLAIRDTSHQTEFYNKSDAVSARIPIRKSQAIFEIRTNLLATQFILGFILTGKSNTYIATPITERRTKQQRNLIGFASGPMMIAMRIEEKTTIHELKNNLSIELKNNFKNYLPLPLIDRKEHHKVSINLFDQSFFANTAPWKNITYQYMQANSMGLDIFIHCFKNDNAVDIQIHYDVGLYSNEFMKNYIEKFSEILIILNKESMDNNTISEFATKLQIDNHEIA